uniref:Uncharacterized protein n=1 Tax=Arundo donax TaxID=35708 RepID=A0A0A9BTF1_ARUDO
MALAWNTAVVATNNFCTADTSACTKPGGRCVGSA